MAEESTVDCSGMAMPNLCDACVHYKRGTTTCSSFPAGIPRDIFIMGEDHRTTIMGEEPFQLDPAHQRDYDNWLHFIEPGLKFRTRR